MTLAFEHKNAVELFDSLTHVTRDGTWFSSNHRAGADDLLSHMRDYGVQKAIVSALPNEETNQFVFEFSSNHSGSMFAVPLVLDCNTDTHDLIEDWVRLGAKAIKFHPRLTGLRLSDPKTVSVAKEAISRNLPIFVCSTPYGLNGVRITDLLKFFEDLGPQFSAARLVLLHGGGSDLLNVTEMVRPYPNILIDLSSTLTRFFDGSVGRDISHLLRTFDRRIVIGTDFPEFTYDEVFEALNFLPIDIHADLANRIMSGNLARFLSA